MTFGELHAGDPAVGNGPLAQSTRIWVVVYAGHLPNWGSGPVGSPHPAGTWAAWIIDATSGALLESEESSVGAWPPWFDKLPDGAWFCPG